VILDGVSTLLADIDPRAAYQLASVYRRLWLVNGLLPAGVAERLGPQAVAELDERAAAMTVDDAIELGMLALDRFLSEPVD
jgi:hypothetical protein